MQRTELSLFAQEVQRVLAPLLSELAEVAVRLRAASGDRALPVRADEVARELGGVARELGELGARVDAERASVFVFGPAKAGKSTLLAALAGAQAGMVTSLPGYPCLLRARHAERDAVTLVRFDGTTEDLADPAGLRVVLQRAHGELAAEVRAALRRGEAFDPARHQQEALRRVERSLPAELLARTHVELVECPPLHAPLFSSYGAMLIGEPDAARAAVFVVRAAQLADDAVFDQLAELLATFERLHLVINLDEKSRELSPAGELAPGLEREDPSRLVEALERFTTSELLAGALRSGRVPVLTLDLLEAARARLSGQEDRPRDASRRTRFADLLAELGATLDHHEALHALVSGALRRAGELLEEARELAAQPGLGELGARLAALEAERAAGERRRLALTRLGERESALWEAEELAGDVRTRLEAGLGAAARELAAGLALPLATLLEDWFADGASLQELLDQRLAPRLAAAEHELARGGERLLAEVRRAPLAPERLSAAVRRDLTEAGLELADLARTLAAHPGASPTVPSPPVAPALPLRPLDVQAIPVKPRFRQRLTLRGAADVRRAFFGPSETPDHVRTGAEKARRLGSEALAVMKRSVEERALATLSERARALARDLHAAWTEAFLASLRRELAGELARRAEPERLLAERVTLLSALARELASLAQALPAAQAGLGELDLRFQQPGTLQPAPPPATGARAGSERQLEGLPALE